MISRTSVTTYQKAKYQENPEVQLTYKKWKCLQIAEMKKNYQKMKFLSNLEIKEQYKKGYKENPRTSQKIKKNRYQKY